MPSPERAGAGTGIRSLIADRAAGAVTVRQQRVDNPVFSVAGDFATACLRGPVEHGVIASPGRPRIVGVQANDLLPGLSATESRANGMDEWEWRVAP